MESEIHPSGVAYSKGVKIAGGTGGAIQIPRRAIGSNKIFRPLGVRELTTGPAGKHGETEDTNSR
jgi:hypothetical protein